MKDKHSCELLDEDRFAAHDDFEEEQGIMKWTESMRKG